MSRHPDPGFDPRIADWLEADPNLAPPDVMRTVESAIPSVPQRRVLRLPWRSLPMNRTILVFATVSLLAVLGIGIVTVGSRPPSADASPPAAIASPTPSAVTGDEPLAAYVTAHDAICRAAVAEKKPLIPRYEQVTAPGATEAQRADGIQAIAELASIVEGVARDLLALEVPPDVLVDHVQYATRLEDVAVLLRREVLLLRAGRPEQAAAIDEVTNPINARVEAFEQEYRLAGCP